MPMTVQDVLQRLLPRANTIKPGCSIFDAVRSVHSIILNRLILHRSDLLQEWVSLNFDPEGLPADLPAGFTSFAERPRVVGGEILTPLNRHTSQELLTPAAPRYYDVIGRKISLFPPPIGTVTMQAKIFSRPAEPADLDDVLPFDGFFDEVYCEGAFSVMAAGLAAVSDRGFVATIESQVDAALSAKAMADEQMIADAINFGA